MPLICHPFQGSEMGSGATLDCSLFLFTYLVSCQCQVYLLLNLAGWLVWNLWSRGIDPDNAAIPYLTSLGDLIGGLLLAMVFYFNQGTDFVPEESARVEL